MVRTRSRATSPDHQVSRDASSNPQHDRQSTPITQPPSIQHVQSMAAAMVELTHQNQELTRGFGLRRQRHETYIEGQARVKKIEEMLSRKPVKGYCFREGTALGEGNGLDEEGHG